MSCLFLCICYFPRLILLLFNGQYGCTLELIAYAFALTHFLLRVNMKYINFDSTNNPPPPGNNGWFWLAEVVMIAPSIFKRQLPPQASSKELKQRSCPLHAGLEPSSSPLHNGNGHHGNNYHHQQQFRSTIDGGSSEASNRWPGCMNGSRSQQQRQPPLQTECSSRWTGETPTPTATPTPTPTSANLLPNAHQHINQLQAPPPPWFQAYLPREVALELLTHEEVGASYWIIKMLKMCRYYNLPRSIVAPHKYLF